MKIIILIIGIYSLILIASSILAPYLANAGVYELSSYISSTLSHCCHQNPLRSFWFFGYPAALCSRCLGFYSGCFISCFTHFKLNKYFISLLTIFILADIMLNFVMKFDTSNPVRFTAGFFMGFLFIVFLRKWRKS